LLDHALPPILRVVRAPWTSALTINCGLIDIPPKKHARESLLVEVHLAVDERANDMMQLVRRSEEREAGVRVSETGDTLEDRWEGREGLIRLCSTPRSS
jgi:hypothetical protein